MNFYIIIILFYHLKLLLQPISKYILYNECHVLTTENMSAVLSAGFIVFFFGGGHNSLNPF
jgi:hypothetical protein